jgi:hypothetical protein
VPRLLTILTATAILAAGCGSDEERNAQNQSSEKEATQLVVGGSLAADDVAQATMAVDSVDTACGLTDDQQGSDVPLDDAVATLQRLYRNNKDASIMSGLQQLTEPITVETLVKQTAKELRGCGKVAEATELEQVVKS